MTRWEERMWGAWLGGAMGLQGWLVAPAMDAWQAAQYALGWACLGVLVATLWWERARLDPHADMVLIMTAAGGAGMAWSLPGDCHVPRIGVLAHWWNMSSWMYGMGLVPAALMARCLARARRRGCLGRALALDAAGMGLGMLAGMQLAGGSMLSRHLAMMGGMELGMLAGMAARVALLESGEIRRGWIFVWTERKRDA